MNIGTIYTLYGRRAGAELYFEKIMSEFRKQKNSEIKFIVFCNKNAESVLKNMNLGDYEIIYLSNLDNQYKKAFWLEFLSKKYVEKYNINLFWIPSGTNHFPGKWNIPAVVTFHDFGEYHIKAKYVFVRMVYRKFICIRNSIKRGSAFTCVSLFTANDLLKLYGKKSAVIHNGASPQEHIFQWKSKEQVVQFVQNECKINLRYDFFFTPGRTDFIGKGLDVLLQAAKNFKQNFILCGPEGEGHNRFIQNLPDNVVYLGRVSEKCLSALYYLCKAVIFPSRFEGFGFPVLEAFQYKKPLIVSDGGALPEVASDAGLIFEAGNKNDLLQKIERFLEMPELEIEHLTEKGNRRLQDFSWEKCIGEMKEVFNLMTGSN